MTAAKGRWEWIRTHLPASLGPRVLWNEVELYFRWLGWGGVGPRLVWWCRVLERDEMKDGAVHEALFY